MSSSHLKRRSVGAIAAATALAVGALAAPRAHAQTQPSPATAPTTQQPANQPAQPLAPGAGVVSPELRGRPVEGIRINGNTRVSTAVILNVIRTRQGEPFEPATVEEDYRRVYDLRKFSNVEARVEPTANGGVIVSFTVSEQQQIGRIDFKGLKAVDDATLREIIDIRAGEAVDRFRVNIAREAIENYYREKNYPFVHVNIDEDGLARTGDVVFNVVEGPNVRVRKVKFIGNKSVTADKLYPQVRTNSWIFIFRPGTFRPDVVEQDVGAIRRYYEGKGYFDVRVGRKLIFSPDLSELMVEFLIDEGQRYTVDRVTFLGNQTVDETALRQNLRLTEGKPFDNETVQRDVRSMVDAYSPYGFIFDPERKNPAYLQIEPRTVFRREAGKVELVYDISEGERFKLGRVLVRGNWKTQDKVVLREMRMQPGQTYDSGEVADAADRLRGTPYFQGISITPIGDEPGVRDLLVEVTEGKTANFTVGAGVNSNGGVGGNLSFEQKNFDLGNPPDSFLDILSDRSFTGAGQNLRISLEPGTRQTNASIRFSEPYLFDQPYSFSGEGYIRNRDWQDYDDKRMGARFSIGKRFNYVYSASVSLRAEQVEIDDVEDKAERAPEIVLAEGYSALTSLGFQLRRDTSNRGPLAFRGSVLTFGTEFVGALGGDYDFTKLSAGWDRYITLNTDLQDRRTVLSLRADAGYIFSDAPFFERYYGGGIGSVRGFDFRGISPRSGLNDDAIGGNFVLTGTAELSFPLAGETLRGVVFADAGTVEEEFEVDTIRSSAGFGFRLTLPVFGQLPLAVDFAVPLSKDDLDEVQYISFSFGFLQ
ncbi:MAG TPA: BamA/TamA family outer membrane protein [Tepidisphaeraceae bacterium]|nr:BamA/TamA family outer membrane protein [Tepidisphaeraceae bacterium]